MNAILIVKPIGLSTLTKYFVMVHKRKDLDTR